MSDHANQMRAQRRKGPVEPCPTCGALRPTPAAPPAQGVGYPTMDDIAKPMIDGGVAESHANWYASGYVAAYKLLNTRPSPQAAIRVGEAEIVHDLRIAATFCDFHDHNLLAGRIRTFADHLQSTGGAVK